MNDAVACMNRRAAGASLPVIRRHSTACRLFYGDANPAEARLYARLAGDELRTESEAFGHGHRADVRVQPHAAGDHSASWLGDQTPALLAEAIVADPCFWSPDLPLLYRVQCRAERVGQGHRSRRSAGWASGRWPLAGRRLIHCGKNLVLRGGRQRLQERRANGRMACGRCRLVAARSRRTELLAEASRLGVWLVARLLTGDARCKIARWPAVVLCVLPAMPRWPASIATIAENVILAASVWSRRADPASALVPVAMFAASDDALADRRLARTSHTR